MTSKSLKVFISSTMVELRDVREVVGKALTDHGIEAVVYETTIGAQPDTIVRTSLREVEDSDVYIGLFWKKYGDITIEEYRHARKYNKPCFIYIRDQGIEREPALEAFLEREVCPPDTGVAFSYFESALHLGNAVAEDIMEWLVRRYRELSAQINAADVSLDERHRLQANLSDLQAISREPLPQGDSVDNLARQLREWFQAVGYSLERDVPRLNAYAEIIVNIPRRRSGHDRILVHAVDGEIEISDVHALRSAVDEHKFDEGWLVSERRVSRAARDEAKNQVGLSTYTLDELIDEEVNWDQYFKWLEEEIRTKGIDRYYVHLAGTVDDFDTTGKKLGTSRYERLDDYFNLWLDDPSKEHVSILGEFGTGKTWFTLHFAYEMLKRYKEAKEKGLKRPRIPLIIRLRNYAQGFKDVGALLSEFIFREHQISLPSYRAFEQLNRMGRLLLIFDGFDEMAARVDRQKMVNNFWQLAEVVVPGSKAILTCRTEHFHYAQQERDVLGARLKASTGNVILEPPKFEVLHLEMFEVQQIREVLKLRTNPPTAELIMGNSELIDMARRPVLIEFILEALPDIKVGKAVEIAHIYYYAVQRKMERDIKAERTFTSLADKLYFLCELSWEMLFKDKLSLNYKLFPDCIRRYFGHKVAEIEEDHWHYDLLGQTMLVRDTDGNYSPAHRSLLEFFVAYKLAAEMGALPEMYMAAARKQSGISENLPTQDYSWSSYFTPLGSHEESITMRPLRRFSTEPMNRLVKTLGAQPLTFAVLELLHGMVMTEKLPRIIEATRDHDVKEVGYVGGNVATILNRFREPFGKFKEALSKTILVGADLRYADLNRADLHGANITSSNLQGANMRSADFREVNASGSVICDAAPRVISWSPEGKYLVGAGHSDAIQIWETESWQEKAVLHAHEGMIEALSWNYDGKWLASGGTDCNVKIWNPKTWQVHLVLPSHKAPITVIAWSNQGSILAVGDRQNNIRLWNVRSEKVIGELRNLPSINYMCFNAADTHLAIACSTLTRIYVWEHESDIIAHRDVGQFLSSYKCFGFDLKKWNLESLKRFGFPEWILYQQETRPVPGVDYMAIPKGGFIEIWRASSNGDRLKELVKQLGGRIGCTGLLIKGIKGLDDTTYQDLLSRGANDTFNGSLKEWVRLQGYDTEKR